MNKCYLDSNLLLYFFNQESAYHQQAVQALEKLVATGTALYISGLVLDEVLFILNKTAEMSGQEFNHQQRLQVFTSLKQIANLSLVNVDNSFKVHEQVSGVMAEYNLQPRDAYHVLYCLENNIGSLASFDHDFDCFGQKIIKDLI